MSERAEFTKQYEGRFKAELKRQLGDNVHVEYTISDVHFYVTINDGKHEINLADRRTRPWGWLIAKGLAEEIHQAYMFATNQSKRRSGYFNVVTIKEL